MGVYSSCSVVKSSVVKSAAHGEGVGPIERADPCERELLYGVPDFPVQVEDQYGVDGFTGRLSVFHPPDLKMHVRPRGAAVLPASTSAVGYYLAAPHGVAGLDPDLRKMSQEGHVATLIVTDFQVATVVSALLDAHDDAGRRRHDLRPGRDVEINAPVKLLPLSDRIHRVNPPAIWRGDGRYYRRLSRQMLQDLEHLTRFLFGRSELGQGPGDMDHHTVHYRVLYRGLR